MYLHETENKYKKKKKNEHAVIVGIRRVMIAKATDYIMTTCSGFSLVSNDYHITMCDYEKKSALKRCIPKARRRLREVLRFLNT